LPIDANYRNPKLGAAAPIRVVNVVFTAGDANHGVQTAAFNLPNDERVMRPFRCAKLMEANTFATAMFYLIWFVYNLASSLVF